MPPFFATGFVFFVPPFGLFFLAVLFEWVALRGVKTSGPMAPEINLDHQRPAQYIFSSEVQKRLSDIRKEEAEAAQAKIAQKASTAA